MVLAAYAAPSGNCGVPFFVVLWACRILANNKDGTLRVLDADVDLDTPARDTILLQPGDYAYRVPGEVHYAICTTFHAWAPPKFEDMPDPWRNGTMRSGVLFPDSTDSSVGDVVKGADGKCVVTGDFSRRESCDLVPKAETPWWTYHSMNAKTHNAEGINSTANCLTMRADLIAAGMDKGNFVFVPYDGKAACLCIRKAVADFAVEYHLRAIDMPQRIHPLNVYVRFAWGIFKASARTLRGFASDRSSVTVREPNLSEFALLKRRRAADDDAGREEQEGNADGGDDKEQGIDDAVLSGADECFSDAASEPSLNLCVWSERDLEVAERLDAALADRPLAPYEAALGIYPGYSKMLRLQQEYRKQHPEVFTVRSARVAYVGEDNDEHWL
ncbi:hypothetical protein GGX14DRAFT_583025 [Mycena pura]|uniref:HNH nuclease domain-containing protein n=1 Tax=Mycena pura TaxID=153505 RepID=A0AAD6YV38_9AGAR|nr:hypothetical protein GGX14DRAFT_583025 [Mycena pura]